MRDIKNSEKRFVQKQALQSPLPVKAPFAKSLGSNEEARSLDEEDVLENNSKILLFPVAYLHEGLGYTYPFPRAIK